MNLTCKSFGELTDAQIRAVMQLTFQLIGSASGHGITEADDPSIDIMMDRLGFSGILTTLGNAYWNEAMDEMDPFGAFRLVSQFNPKQKTAFKEMILAISKKDNQFLRMNIASQIFTRTNIEHVYDGETVK